MKKQTEYPNKKINRYGCYFCVMLRFAEIATGKELSEEAVMRIYDKAQKAKGWNGQPVMNENCFLSDPQEVANLALKEFRNHKKIKQVGIECGGKRTFWEWYRPRSDFDFVAVEYRTSTGSHFVATGYNPDPSVELLGEKKKIFYKLF